MKAAMPGIHSGDPGTFAASLNQCAACFESCSAQEYTNALSYTYCHLRGFAAKPLSSSLTASSGRPGPIGYSSARKIEPKRYAMLNAGSNDVVTSSNGYS